MGNQWCATTTPDGGWDTSCIRTTASVAIGTPTLLSFSFLLLLLRRRTKDTQGSPAMVTVASAANVCCCSRKEDEDAEGKEEDAAREEGDRKLLIDARRKTRFDANSRCARFLAAGKCVLSIASMALHIAIFLVVVTSSNSNNNNNNNNNGSSDESREVGVGSSFQQSSWLLPGAPLR